MSTRSAALSGWIWTETATGRWQVRDEFAVQAFLNRLDAPQRLLEPPAVSLRTDSRPRPTSVVSVVLPEFPTTPLAVKQYQAGLWRSLKDLIRPGRAARAFSRAWLLEKHDIPTAQPIAAGAVKRRGFPAESYFITAFLAETKPLRYFRRVERDPRRDRHLVRELGRMMGQLHNLRLAHTDPSLSNFLVRTDRRCGPLLVLVDVDGLRPVADITQRRVVNDLCRLLQRIPMTPRERLWFAAEYCAKRGDQGGTRDLVAAFGLNCP